MATVHNDCQQGGTPRQPDGVAQAHSTEDFHDAAETRDSPQESPRRESRPQSARTNPQSEIVEVVEEEQAGTFPQSLTGSSGSKGSRQEARRRADLGKSSIDAALAKDDEDFAGQGGCFCCRGPVCRCLSDYCPLIAIAAIMLLVGGLITFLLMGKDVQNNIYSLIESLGKGGSFLNRFVRLYDDITFFTTTSVVTAVSIVLTFLVFIVRADRNVLKHRKTTFTGRCCGFITFRCFMLACAFFSWLMTTWLVVVLALNVTSLVAFIVTELGVRVLRSLLHGLITLTTETLEEIDHAITLIKQGFQGLGEFGNGIFQTFTGVFTSIRPEPERIHQIFQNTTVGSYFPNLADTVSDPNSDVWNSMMRKDGMCAGDDCLALSHIHFLNSQKCICVPHVLQVIQEKAGLVRWQLYFVLLAVALMYIGSTMLMCHLSSQLTKVWYDQHYMKKIERMAQKARMGFFPFPQRPNSGPVDPSQIPSRADITFINPLKGPRNV